MIDAITLIDRPQAAELRQRMRPVHKEHLAALADRIASAGRDRR